MVLKEVFFVILFLISAGRLLRRLIRSENLASSLEFRAAMTSPQTGPCLKIYGVQISNKIRIGSICLQGTVQIHHCNSDHVWIWNLFCVFALILVWFCFPCVAWSVSPVSPGLRLLSSSALLPPDWLVLTHACRNDQIIVATTRICTSYNGQLYAFSFYRIPSVTFLCNGIWCLHHAWQAQRWNPPPPQQLRSVYLNTMVWS